MVDVLIETMNKLLQAPFRLIRFSTMVAYTSLFRSLVTSLDETEQKLSVVKSKKKSNNKRMDERLLQDTLKEIENFLNLSFEFIIFNESRDVCPAIREEVYSCLTYYIEKQGLKNLDEIKAENDTEITDVVLHAINDKDKEAKLKGIELVTRYLEKNFSHVEVNNKEAFYENIFKIVLINLINGDGEI